MYGGSVDSTVYVDSPMEHGLSVEFACSSHACLSFLHHQKHAQINKTLQWLWHCPKPELSLWLRTTFCVLDCIPVQMKCRSLCYDQSVCLLVRSTPHLSVLLKNRFQLNFSCKSSSSISLFPIIFSVLGKVLHLNEKELGTFVTDDHFSLQVKSRFWTLLLIHIQKNCVIVLMGVCSSWTLHDLHDLQPMIKTINPADFRRSHLVQSRNKRL